MGGLDFKRSDLRKAAPVRRARLSNAVIVGGMVIGCP
jgi:hypothetical protein